MKRSILYVKDTPISKRDFERYGINELKKKYDITILQFSSYFRNEYIGQDDISNKVKFYLFEEIDSLRNFLENNNFLICIDLLSLNNTKIFYLRLLLYYFGAKRLIFRMNEIPNLEGKRQKIGFINEILKHQNPFKIFWEKLTSKLLMIITSKASFAFLAGDIAIKKYKKLARRVFSVHSMDYDLFHSLEHSDMKMSEENYVVFLDQSSPDHPDYKFHNLQPPVTASRYYPSMNKIFEAIEDNLKLEVVIAMHPKSISNSLTWGERRIFKGQTSQLVRNSSLVLAHYSTAISFAVLASKPILQLTSDEYEISIRSNRIKAFKNMLNLKCLNIDNFTDSDLNQDIFQFDDVAYDTYTRNFLKSYTVDYENKWDWDQIF